MHLEGQGQLERGWKVGPHRVETLLLLLHVVSLSLDEHSLVVIVEVATHRGPGTTPVV